MSVKIRLTGSDWDEVNDAYSVIKANFKILNGPNVKRRMTGYEQVYLDVELKDSNREHIESPEVSE